MRDTHRTVDLATLGWASCSFDGIFGPQIPNGEFNLIWTQFG
jgi:hypothetical protein